MDKIIKKPLTLLLLVLVFFLAFTFIFIMRQQEKNREIVREPGYSPTTVKTASLLDTSTQGRRGVAYRHIGLAMTSYLVSVDLPEPEKSSTYTVALKKDDGTFLTLGALYKESSMDTLWTLPFSLKSQDPTYREIVVLLLKLGQLPSPDTLMLKGLFNE